MTQQRITQGEAIEKAVELGSVVTGMNYDAVLFSQAFEGYLTQITEMFDIIQDEPAMSMKISDAQDYQEMCDSLRRGEG